MLEIRTSNEADAVFYVDASGVLDRKDYRREMPKLEHRLEGDGGRARLFVKLNAFRGWTAPALLEEMRFYRKYRKRFDRIAVLGAGRLARVATAISRPLYGGAVRFFTRDEEADAKTWITEGRTSDRPLSAPEPARNDLADEASMESFPASDPPGYTPSRM